MSPEPGDPLEAEGVLNPASGRDARRRPCYLLPRLVAEGNVSRVGLAEVDPDGRRADRRSTREGVVLAPDAGWERGKNNAGVEDPRVTWIPTLGHARDDLRRLRAARARSRRSPSRRTCATWTRLGPLQFALPDDLDTDLNLFPNKDVVPLPRAGARPGRRARLAMLHRPMWDLDWSRPARACTCRPG